MPDCKLQGLNWPGVVWWSNNPHQPLNLVAGLWQQNVKFMLADVVQTLTIKTTI